MGVRSGKARSANSRFMGVWCLALSMLAILLWGKLKLVTGVPRTAYADPHQQVTPAVPAPASHMPETATTRVPADRPDLIGD